MSAPRYQPHAGPGRRGSWFASPPPSVAVEIGAGRVTAVVLGTVDGAPAVTAQATERLPDGLVAPSLTTPNLTDKAAVAAAVERVLRAVGVSRGRVALVIPDGAAKVSAGPLREGAGQGRRPRPAGALAGAQVGAVPARAVAGVVDARRRPMPPASTTS